MLLFLEIRNMCAHRKVRLLSSSLTLYYYYFQFFEICYSEITAITYYYYILLVIDITPSLPCINIFSNYDDLYTYPFYLGSQGYGSKKLAIS